MKKSFLVIFLFLFSNVSFADVYDDFVEDHILKEPRSKYISKYRSQKPPEDVDSQEWNIKIQKVEDLANKEMSKNGDLFERIKEVYKSRLSPEEMQVYVEFVRSPKYQDILSKNRQAKEEIKGILYGYMFEEFPEKLSEIMDD